MQQQTEGIIPEELFEKPEQEAPDSADEAITKPLIFANIESGVYSTAFSPDGRKIVAGLYNGALKLFDAISGTSIRKPFQGHESYVRLVAFSPDGNAIVSCSDDWTLRLWDLQGNQIGLPFQGHNNIVWSVAFSPDGKTIVSGSEDKTLRLWDLQGNSIANLAGRIRQSAETVETKIPDSVTNDSAQGEDSLNVKDEIEALATVLMLRSLKAPVAVGILGGWGSGKSFGMNLIQQTVVKIRNQKLDSAKAWGNIDDLDRCPPNRVVEVLESVQLLLNTQLFIVVLGIDDRYIARALEQVYQGVLKRGAKPSGLDYLEKIIQIPYRMRPISKTTVEGYLRPQLKIRSPNFETDETVSKVTDKQPIAQSIAKTDSEPQVKREISSDRNEKSPSQPIVSDDTVTKIEAIAKTIEFDEEEFQLLLNCCKHVDITPRTAKRLLNIYKILQFIWSTRSQKILPKDPPTDLDKRIVMSFLALSGRYPEYIRNLFEEIDVLFEEADCDPLEIYLDKLLKLIKPTTTQSDRYAHREWRKFTNDIKRMLEPNDAFPPKLKIDRDVFDLMLSFCFVGDIGYDPDDAESKV